MLCLFCLTVAPWVAAQDTTYVFTDLGHEDDLSSEANAISVGRGVYGGSDRAFLLTPILFVDGFEDGTLDGWDGVFP